MKILSYRELTQMKPVFAAKTEKPLSTTIFDLAAWQQEVIAIMGPRKKCLALLSQVLLKGSVAPTLEIAQAKVEETFNLIFEQKLLSSTNTISDLLSDIITEQVSIINNSDKQFALKKVLWAAYLQPYVTLTYRQLTSPVRQRFLFIYLYLCAKQYVLLPDLLSPADEYDKILLHKTLQNLRLLFNEPKTIFFYTQNPEEAIFISDRILLLTHTTAGLADIISVLFKEPRHRHIVSQLPAFKAIRKKLIFALSDAFAPKDLLLPSSIDLFS